MGFSEKEFEDWLWELPNFYCADDSFRWIARQLEVASGFVDLVGIQRGGDESFHYYTLHVVEVKARPLSSRNVAQVCRYAADIRWKKMAGVDFTSVEKAIIGLRPTGNDVLFAADAMGVKVFYADADMHVTGPYKWDSKFRSLNRKKNRAAKAKVENGVEKYIEEMNIIDEDWKRLNERWPQ